MDDILLDVRNLRTHFTLDDGIVQGGRRRRLRHSDAANAGHGRRERLRQERDRALDHADGAAAGQAGRSGRLDHFARANGEQSIDLATLDPYGQTIRSIRGNEIAMIFQEPMASLSPVHTIGEQIMEMVLLHRTTNKREAKEIVLDMLDKVGMPQPSAALRRLPAPALGRHAPARDDRHGAVVQPSAADRRRADDRAGCDRPGADPRADARLCKPNWAWRCCLSPTIWA